MTPGASPQPAKTPRDQSLTDLLKALIRTQGPLTVAQFMTTVLTHPTQGYYRTAEPLGKSGDFITAPEISQIFGELIGLWCVQAWSDLGAPPAFQLMEMGPGRGTLMADLLRAARGYPAFLSAVELHFVETNTPLRAAQQAALPPGVKAVWHEKFEARGAGPLILIANEFFDCLPIRQFVRRGQNWHERCVAVTQSGDLCFVLSPAPIPAGDNRGSLASTPQADVREISHGAQGLIAEIAHDLKRRGGRALIIDYGYGTPGAGDTLQALHHHAPCDVLETPGGVDLTAHVDFSALTASAAEAGALVAGPMEQGDFLKALGLEARAEALRAHATAQQKRTIDSAVERLTAPDQMGTLFKALCLSAPGLPPPPGFLMPRQTSPQS